MSTLTSPYPTLPCLLWCPGGTSAPWGWMGVVLAAGLALAVLSSPRGLKVMKRGRSSSMGSPVPGKGEKKAQGREASSGASGESGGLQNTPCSHQQPWQASPCVPQAQAHHPDPPQGEHPAPARWEEKLSLGPQRRKAQRISDVGRGGAEEKTCESSSPSEVLSVSGQPWVRKGEAEQLLRDLELDPELPTPRKTTLIPSRCLRGWKMLGLVGSESEESVQACLRARGSSHQEGHPQLHQPSPAWPCAPAERGR